MKPKQLLLIAVALAASPLVTRADSPTPAPSISELLQKGIYDEETKGDVDAAISDYKQLIAQAAANDSVAARAEFRLAQCYLKQNKKDEATAEFQKLVNDFPNEKDLVAKAKVFLPGEPKLIPAPWVDGERLLLKCFGPDGSEMGAEEERENLVQSGTQSIWRVGRIQSIVVNTVSSVDTDADTFRPISSHWKMSTLGEVRAFYRPGEVDLFREGKSGPTTIKVGDGVVDNVEALQYMRRLPLAEGFQTTMPIFSTLGGTPVSIKVNVSGKESVDTPAGTFECYKIKLDVVDQTFWISHDPHHYLVQFEAGPATAKLVLIGQRGLDEPVVFQDGDLGVSLTAPPEWLVFRLKKDDPDTLASISIHDSTGDMEDGAIYFMDTSKLPAEEQNSLQGWAGNAEKNVKKFGTGVVVRPGAWTSWTVAGLPGLSFVADYKVNGKPKTIFALDVIGPKDTTRFIFTCAPDKFDGLMKQFNGIIASYQRK